MALPSGYKQLEYIRSTGEQFIDTEYFPKWNTRIVDDIKMSAYSGTRAPFGTRNSNSATATKGYSVFQTGANTFRSDYFGSSVTITLDITTDQRVTIDRNKNVCTIAGKTGTNTAVTAGEATYTLTLFTYSNSGSAGSKSVMDRYSTKIYEDNTLVHDYIPCETGNGEIGLWDDVEGVFRGNDGTGVFIAGPEVVTDPMAPHDGHNTNAGGVARKIESGTTQINGVLREIEKGIANVSGIGCEIEFDYTREMYTAEISGEVGGYYVKVTADTMELSGGTTYEIENGTQFTVVVKSDYTASYIPGRIYLNGVLIDSTTYTFSANGNLTINGINQYTSALGGGFYGIAEITME